MFFSLQTSWKYAANFVWKRFRRDEKFEQRFWDESGTKVATISAPQMDLVKNKFHFLLMVMWHDYTQSAAVWDWWCALEVTYFFYEQMNKSTLKSPIPRLEIDRFLIFCRNKFYTVIVDLIFYFLFCIFRNNQPCALVI